MTTNVALEQAAAAAREAAEKLAERAAPHPRTRELTVHNHAALLKQLGEATAALSGRTGALDCAVRAIAERLVLRSAPATRAEPAFLTALFNLRDAAQAALGKVRLAVVDLESARTYTSERQLTGLHSPPPPDSARHVVAPLATEATARIAELGQHIWPIDGDLDDAALCLDVTAAIAGSLATTCRYEAILVSVAYEAAGVGRNAGSVCETLGSAYTTLITARATLVACHQPLAGLAQRDALLPALHAALRPA